MSGQIRVNTEQVKQIAQTIEKQNNKLFEILKNSQSTVNNLSSSWEGEAAQATLQVYNNFSKKYFQQYHDILNQYVQFLRVNVADGYFQTERENTTIGNDFQN